MAPLAPSRRAGWNTPIPRGRSLKMFGHLIGTITLIDSLRSQRATHFWYRANYSHTAFFRLTGPPLLAFGGECVWLTSERWGKNSCRWLAVQKVSFNNHFPCTLMSKLTSLFKIPGTDKLRIKKNRENSLLSNHVRKCWE